MDAPPPIAGTPLYVHVPFCVVKCTYCDFYSLTSEGHDVDATITDLLDEARVRAPTRPPTVFLGGGTPSLLDEDQLTRLLDGLHAITGFRDSAVEVTAECNPESFDESKARRLLELGVTRLSIGLQSLRAEVLEEFGRAHSPEEGLAAVRAARAAGVRHLNVDLIYAVPGQTVEQWRADLAAVLELGTEHLSAYELTFEEDTPFARWLDEGRIVRPPEDDQLSMFRLTREMTAAAGYEAYEISNFARPGEACRHNENYWRNGPYVGIGPSAVGKLGHRRRGNPRSLPAWRAAVEDLRRGGSGTSRVEDAGPAAPRRGSQPWEEELEPLARLAETWWLGLRTAAGVDARVARETAEYDAPDDPAETLARSFVADGLLEEHAGRYALTWRGLPLADAVGQKFLHVGA